MVFKWLLCYVDCFNGLANLRRISFSQDEIKIGEKMCQVDEKPEDESYHSRQSKFIAQQDAYIINKIDYADYHIKHVETRAKQFFDESEM